MKRVCPNCNKPIKDSSLYFCLSCGHKLDEGLINREHPFEPKRVVFTPKQKERLKIPFKIPHVNLSKKLIVGVSFILLALTVSVLAVVFTLNKAKKSTPAVEVPSQEVVVDQNLPNSTDLNLPQENIDLSDTDYTKYIPYGNYFYILGADALDFHRRFFGGAAADSLLYGLDPYLEGKFILVGGYEDEAWYMTSILYLKDEESKDQTFEEVNKEGWFVQKVDDVLVLTEKEEMLDAVSESSKGLSKNISHHPKFRMQNTEVPDEGQLLYVNLMNKEDVIEEMVRVYSPGQTVVEALKDIYSEDPSKFVIRSNQ